jgi:organic radical activating enzyme
MLEVCEIFYSLQGEGRFAGRPSVFLRLGGCNLSCEGFGVEVRKEGKTLIGCDSIHAVNREHFRSTWKQYEKSADLIRDIAASVPNKRPFDIVLTGGEPTLFYANPVLLEVLEHFLGLGCGVTVETNATVAIHFEHYPLYKACTFAMAVKLSNSLEPEARRINHKAIRGMAENGTDSFFKFVLDAANLSVLAKELESVSRGYDIPVYCMPLGESSEVMGQNDRAVFELCTQKGYCYSDRAHIRVWGKKGGV